MVTLVTFDIDGTLIHAKNLKPGQESNSLHKLALHHGAKVAAGVDVHVKEVKHHGCTDRGILRDMFELRGVTVTEEILKEAIGTAAAQYPDADWGASIELLPGVEALMQALHKREDVVVALVTGNVEEIAWHKMDALNIGQYFTAPRFGGFGGYFCTRRECVEYANKVAAERHGKVELSFHVGDAPADISAATDSQVKPIGVLTGIFSKEDLTSAATNGVQPVVLEDLSDTEAIVALITGA